MLNLANNHSIQLAFPHILDNENSKGAEGPSTITLLEYGDYECEFCLNARAIVDNLLKTFPTHLKFVYRHFPNSEIHPTALICAQAAEAADRQGAFWEMHDQIFQHQRHLDKHKLVQLASRLGLDTEQFSKDLNSTMIHDQILAHMEEARKYLGVTGTPTFFVNGTHRTTDWTARNLWNLVKAQIAS